MAGHSKNKATPAGGFIFGGPEGISPARGDKLRLPQAHGKMKTALSDGFHFGGPEGIRTLDLSDANRTLSQLSYKPGYGKMGWNKIVPPHHYTHFCGKCKCFIPLSAALPSRRRSGGTGPRAHPRPLRCAAPSSSVRTWRPERPPQPPSPGRLRSVSPGIR